MPLMVLSNSIPTRSLHLYQSVQGKWAYLESLQIDAAKITPLFGIKGFMYMLFNLEHLILVSFRRNNSGAWTYAHYVRIEASFAGS